MLEIQRDVIQFLSMKCNMWTFEAVDKQTNFKKSFEIQSEKLSGNYIKELLSFINTLAEESYIVVGDFNDGNISIDDTILSDVAKELGKANVLTFSLGLDRIDYIFVSTDIEVLDYDVLIENMSDHYPIIANINI